MTIAAKLKQRVSMKSKAAASATPKLIYLNVPVSARGGTLRFFMLVHGIKFEEELIEMKDWPARKAQLVADGTNPAGNVPVLHVGERTLTQHVATMRFLARSNKLTSGDDYGDYVQDLVADEYQNIRNGWVTAAFGPEDAKAAYKAETVPAKLRVLEGLVAKYKTGKIFLSTSKASGAPLWGDAAVFSILFDHVRTKLLDEADLRADFPCLNALYKAYGAIPVVAQWVASKA